MYNRGKQAHIHAPQTTVCYLPVKAGGLLSLNATSPSSLSCVPSTFAYIFRSIDMPRSASAFVRRETSDAAKKKNAEKDEMSGKARKTQTVLCRGGERGEREEPKRSRLKGRARQMRSLESYIRLVARS